MKKLTFSLSTLLALLLSFNACTNDVPSFDEQQEGKPSRVKSLTTEEDGWEETFTFSYREDGRVSSILNSYEGGHDEIIYDWSVGGKLSITKEGKVSTYDVNEKGYVTSDPKGDYYNTYEYDDDGILVKVTEHWDGGSEVKFTVETKAKNVLKHISKRDGRDYEKVFGYAPGLNMCHIQQTNPVSSYWKSQSGIHGIASNRIINGQNVGFADSDGTNTKLSYKFDDFKRPVLIDYGFKKLRYTYED